MFKFIFLFQAEDGIRDLVRSRGLGDVYKRQVGIRSGLGQWPGVVAHHLMDADFTPMLSPRLAMTIGGIGEPADLLKLPILSPDDPWWKEWFALAGVSADGLAAVSYKHLTLPTRDLV